MVLLASDPHVMEVKVCNLSLYRHERSNHQLAMRRNNATTRDNIIRHRLPLVEPHPFTKTSWRREKSMPDFYDRQANAETIPANGDEDSVASLTSRLMASLMDERRSLETGSPRNKPVTKQQSKHPKVEFTFGSITPWRTQDFIPSFVSRFERSRGLQRFNERHELHETAGSPSARLSRDQTKKLTYKISVDGDHLNQRILKRHLLYLSPLDSFGHPAEPKSLPASLNDQDIHREFEAEENFRLKNSHTSKRQPHFVFNDSKINGGQGQSNGGKVTTGSSHNFNSKIGAARSALDILGRTGAPTSLELSLKEELASTMERLRHDRALVQSFLVNTSSQYMPTERNATPGERLLRQAREANRSRKKSRKHVSHADDSGHIESQVDRFPNIIGGGNLPFPGKANMKLDKTVDSHIITANRQHSCQEYPESDATESMIDNEHTVKEEKDDAKDLKEIINTPGGSDNMRKNEEQITENMQGKISIHFTLGRSSSARETRSSLMTSEGTIFANRHVPMNDVIKDVNTRNDESGEDFLEGNSRIDSGKDSGVVEGEEIGDGNEDLESYQHNERPKTTTEYLQRIMVKMEPSAAATIKA